MCHDLVYMKRMTIVPILLLCGCGAGAENVAEYGCEVVRTYPHDRGAFTEGLFFLNGDLYESTGEHGESNIRKVRLETGEVLQQRDLPAQYFGEGIVPWGDKLIQLEYKSGTGFVYDLATFAMLREFRYPPEGWALTTDGKRLLMDDGTDEIRFWDPETLQETGRLKVTMGGRPLRDLNELEWVNGEIFANIWLTEKIARIDPVSGKVTGIADCRGILKNEDRVQGGEKATDVMNGIAYDAAGGRLFITGKRWPKLFEIKLVPKSGAKQ